MRPLAWASVLLTVVIGSVLSLDLYEYQADLAYCSDEEPFLTLRNVAIQTCVSECHMRQTCEAVNYWRQRRNCEMMFTDGGLLVQQNSSDHFCYFIKKRDIQPPSSIDMSVCLTCNNATACDLLTSSCLLKECRRLEVENGVVLGNMLGVNARVKIVCNDGYILNPPSQSWSACKSDGTWRSVPTCIPDSGCGVPPTVAEATLLQIMTSGPKFFAIYQCKPGYDIPSTESTSVECLSNGTWAAIGFQCLPECNQPPVVENATVATGEIIQGAVRTYSCITGYMENGTTTITCQPDQQWSLIQFECIPACDEPPTVAGATVDTGDRLVGSVRNYTCDLGYAVNGTTTSITCGPNTNWSTVMFECIIDCGEPPSVANAIFTTGGTTVGESRTYTCMPSYVERNVVSMTTTCQAAGMWSGVSFDCLWDCGTPATVVNAAVTTSDTVTGGIGTYTCNSGYTVSGTPTVTCLSGAGWTTVAFSCIVDCGAPPSVANAIIATGNTTIGVSRTYSCMPSYVARSVVSMTTTCQAAGTWSGASFDCLWDCGTLTAVTNAAVTTSDTVTGGIGTYTCNSGYAVSGTPTVTCQSGVGWSAVAFSCVVETCPVNWVEIGSSCYYYSNNVSAATNVHSANAVCHSFSGYLAQFETSAEASAVESWLFTTYPGATVWLGLTDEGTEGTWRWMETNETTTWTDWTSSGANGGYSDNYIRLRDDGMWGDIAWNQDRQYLCEKSPGP